jgi:hypothetical protein
MKLLSDRDYRKSGAVATVILCAIAVCLAYSTRSDLNIGLREMVELGNLKTSSIFLAKLGLIAAAIPVFSKFMKEVVAKRTKLNALLTRSLIAAFLYIFFCVTATFQLLCVLIDLMFHYRVSNRGELWFVALLIALLNAALWNPGDAEHTDPAPTSEIAAK